MGRDSNPHVAMRHSVRSEPLFHTGRGQHRARLPGNLLGLIHEGRRESPSLTLSYPSLFLPIWPRTIILPRMDLDSIIDIPRADADIDHGDDAGEDDAYCMRCGFAIDEDVADRIADDS